MFIIYIEIKVRFIIKKETNYYLLKSQLYYRLSLYRSAFGSRFQNGELPVFSRSLCCTYLQISIANNRSLQYIHPSVADPQLPGPTESQYAFGKLVLQSINRLFQYLEVSPMLSPNTHSANLYYSPSIGFFSTQRSVQC